MLDPDDDSDDGSSASDTAGTDLKTHNIYVDSSSLLLHQVRVHGHRWPTTWLMSSYGLRAGSVSAALKQRPEAPYKPENENAVGKLDYLCHTHIIEKNYMM